MKGGEQIGASRCRRPISLDKLDYELSALGVGDERGRCWIVHGVGEVTNQDAAHTPARHLANSKCAVENAHIGVRSHVQNRVDVAGVENVVDLCSPVGDDIAGRNVQ